MSSSFIICIILLCLVARALQCYNCRGITNYDPNACFNPTYGKTVMQECAKTEVCEVSFLCFCFINTLSSLFSSMTDEEINIECWSILVILASLTFIRFMVAVIGVHFAGQPEHLPQ